MKRIILCSVILLLVVFQTASSEIPKTMSYQGLLTNVSGEPVDDGNCKLIFRLYDTDVGGAALWTETHQAVAVVKGIFNVILGSSTPEGSLALPFDQQYWLGVTVGNGLELTPRIKLTSTAYSLNARSVADGAITTGKLADNAVTSGKIQPNVVSSVDGVSNDGGNVDLISQNAITISSNDSANSITIGESHSARTDNPHNTTASQLGAWSFNGNAGLSPNSFLGTTDNTPLELKVNNARVMRLEHNATSPNLIGGHSENYVETNVYGATIGGGGTIYNENSVSGNHGTIGGGYDNSIHGDSATVGGGYNNYTYGDYATVGGGHLNQAGEEHGTVGGGYFNSATGGSSTIGGGYENTARGDSSTVPGGLYNVAKGHYSFAAGRKATAKHDGSFVWSGSNKSEEDYFESVTDKEFAVRCAGGARFVTQYSGMTPTKWAYLNPDTAQWEVQPASDRNLKANFTPVDSLNILNRLKSIPISKWSYKGEEHSVDHIGPMAQDFYAAFGLGDSDKHINSIDLDGIALSGIQGLYELVKEKEAELAIQKEQNAALRQRVDDLEARLKALEASLTR